jgi:signal transduction histidine kinase
MAPKMNEEKVKPFRLVKYFTYISLIVIFLGTMILSLLNTHWARAMQLKKSEEYALLLVENLNHQVFLQFIIPVALKFGKIQLRNKEQFERMDKVVRSTLHSFNVEMVNIYDMNHIISYSFDQEKVGKKNLGGASYDKALAGDPTSKLIQRGNFWQLVLGYPQKSKISTFAPLRAEKPLSRISGPVLGVVEIVQDLSQDYKAIVRFQVRVILTCAIVMGLLFLVLIFVVKRGENIIHQRNIERIRLKEQLNRAQRLSALGEMIAGISHEIRNPLGIIRSSAELLKKKMAALDPGNAFPDIIVEEANRLNLIITDFLEYAKPKSPRMAPCRIPEILEKNIAFLAGQLREGNHEIEASYETDLPEIKADFDMMYQAFLNILINAMQAMPEGGNIRIDVRSNGGAAVISFQDDGEGIAESALDQIWDPFFTTKETGTGLGLGIVKNIVEAHGGSIDIRNRSRGGADVLLWIPFITNEPPVEKELFNNGYHPDRR